MSLKAPVGRAASARKYDLLSAMMAFGLSAGKHERLLVMRLMALITTRYNWQRDELAVGQREIARLWCVDERTVKREMAKLRARDWVVVKRHGARGRVTVHGLDLAQILRDTRPAWPHIGPDFEARMNEGTAPVPQSNVVPLHGLPEITAGGEVWPAIQTQLRESHPALFAAWFSKLDEVERTGDCLTLAAASPFVATTVARDYGEHLLRAAQSVDRAIRRVEIARS
ncbi:DnaA N-terminal domain-containing protein [Dinoroseobacter sp. S375]|uniref:DnaA N-terminal domain-containing protein n=1 Tax=Dinoroseobacter sp. S375 TaxID=3415136 RepID=UPI003C7C7FD6